MKFGWKWIFHWYTPEIPDLLYCQCNGVFSHGVQFWGLQVFADPARTNNAFTTFAHHAVLHVFYLHTQTAVDAVTSVPSKAVCREIGPTLWKNGSTDIVRMSKRDAFSLLFSQFSAKSNDFGTRTPPILSNLVELAQAQNPREHWTSPRNTGKRYI